MPLFLSSISLIISMALILGAPVTVPAGKPAHKAVTLSSLGFNSPSTVEYI